MYNLLRGEFFKLKRNKSFRWCGFATVVMIVMIFATLELVGQIMQGTVENGTGGVTVTVMGNPVQEGEKLPLEEMGLPGIIQQLFAGEYMMIVLAVFVGIFVAGEYSSGTLKNIIGKGYSRTKVYLSRFLVAAAAMVTLILFGVAVCLACGLVFLGTGAFKGSFWGDFAVYIGLQLVMNIALVAVFMLIDEVIRNMAGSISGGLAIAIFATLVVNGLDLLLVRLGVPVQLTDYCILDLSLGCPTEGLGAGAIGSILLISLLWLAAALGVGIWHFRQTDL